MGSLLGEDREEIPPFPMPAVCVLPAQQVVPTSGLCSLLPPPPPPPAVGNQLSVSSFY